VGREEGESQRGEVRRGEKLNRAAASDGGRLKTNSKALTTRGVGEGVPSEMGEGGQEGRGSTLHVKNPNYFAMD